MKYKNKNTQIEEALGFSMVWSRKFWVLISIYASLVGASYYVSYEIRFDFIVPPEFQQERVRLLPFVAAIKLIFLLLARQLGSMLTFFSIPDLVRLAWAIGAAEMVLFIPRLLGHPELCSPRGVLLVDGIVSFALLCGFRLAMRMYRERLSGTGREGLTVARERVAIIGAGDAGATLAKEFISHPKRGLLPVAFFDDDRSKHGKFIHGLPILGLPEYLPKARATSGVRRVIIAMPSAAQRRIQEVVVLLSGQGYKVEIMPALEELASGRIRVSKVRPVEIEDLLGRQQVELDRTSIRRLVENKVVMVTGAGGSIGSELCRQIGDLNPKRLLLVEQSEVSLFCIEQEMRDRGQGTICEPLVCDVLDEQRLNYIFSRFEPQLVFHAAAHKHVYLMERQPMEAIRNNAVGTRTIARVAADHGVEAFVLISTDKAINPTSVMGATKRLAELHLQAMQTTPGNSIVACSESRGLSAGKTGRRTRFIAVRFGNVLGSSGSVVPIFRKQIEAGGPVTVTHPDVTRYFMTIPEAVGLVMQAAVLDGDKQSCDDFSIYVLDMGQPVKIADLAKQMIELSGFTVGEDIEIRYVGLKPGEKLFEELQHKNEDYEPTAHPRIMRFITKKGDIESSARSIAELESRLYTVDNNEVKRIMQSIIPEYTPHWE